MKYIPLSGEVGAGKFIIVDDQDYDYLSQPQHKWNWDHGYASQCLYVPNSNRLRKRVYIHHLILVTNGMIDHINGNRLDNRRSNLRECNAAQNNANTGLRKDNKSGYKGVYWHKAVGKWAAVYKGKAIGYFHDPIEAGNAYREKHEEVFGEFSRIK